jgi:hypothetical protein
LVFFKQRAELEKPAVIKKMFYGAHLRWYKWDLETGEVTNAS